LINQLRTYQGKPIDKEMLAKEACKIEIDVLKEPIGKQDQYAAAYGGMNYIHFKKDGSVEVEPLELSKNVTKSIQKRLLLFHIGGERSAGDILREQNKKSDKREAVLNKIGSLAIGLKEDLLAKNPDTLGEILDKSWKLKRSLASGISNDRIDDIYDLGMENGAGGGKLLGAGGAGFMLFYALEKDQPRLRSVLKEYREIDFKMQNEGSKVVYDDQR
jgi:D-glycero-alpha-D-manno-heptose-7-phosphate kinase